MSHNKIQPMTKPEIAEFLGVTIEDIYRWAQSIEFDDFLDVCPDRSDKVHDEYDIQVFMLINHLDKRVNEDVPFYQRVESIRRELYSSPEAIKIREKRKIERTHWEIARWTLVDKNGDCLRYDYEWLKPLQPSVDYIVDFGCWASDADAGTCSEPYALLWTLEAAKVVVVDKKLEHIQNAQSWLEITRRQHPYFKDYALMFVVWDMTHKGLTETTDALKENGFDLAYCHNVLYNMYPSPTALQDSINTMASVVKPGGWVIAIEPKMGVEYEERDLPGGMLSLPIPLVGECKDISQYFEAAELVRFNLDDTPECSYCYQKL